MDERPTDHSGTNHIGGVGGDECLGSHRAAHKTTGSEDRVLPVTVIYDSDLTLSLPVDLFGRSSGPNHATLAAEGIRALAVGLPKIVEDPSGTDGRDQALYGAYLAAVSFASAGSGMHHKLCHVLGGTFNLPHAQTHATVLPYVLAFNATDAPEAGKRIAAAFGSTTALGGRQNLRTKLDDPRALDDYGFTADGIAEAVEISLPAIPANNPRKVTAENLTELFQAALTGEDPVLLIREPVRS